MIETKAKQLPACRPERVIELLEDFAANADDYDVYKVAAKLEELFGAQLAEERRREAAAK